MRERSVPVEDGPHLKKAKPEPKGVGGWLALLAFGQVVGVLSIFVSALKHPNLVLLLQDQIPVVVWGEAIMADALALVSLSTASLLFRHSRSFPRFFICQTVLAICFPFVDVFLASLSSTSGPVFVSGLEKDAGQLGATITGALIWIPYVLRSRRVANTFTV
jgi:hypothetical protein